MSRITFYTELILSIVRFVGGFTNFKHETILRIFFFTAIYDFLLYLRSNNKFFFLFPAGIFGLGAVLGGLSSAYLGNRFGRRASLMLLALPDVLGWILMAGSQNLAMMMAGR